MTARADGTVEKTGLAGWILRKLARETSSGNFIPQLDGLRFFAIAAVVLFHVDNLVLSIRPPADPSHDLLHRLFSKGYVGVQLFFAISGFVVALPFAVSRLQQRPAVSLSRYFLRRVTRLEPPYILNLIVMSIAKASAKGMSWIALFPHLVASIFYVHYPVYGEPSRVNAVAWSLEIEIQFYILAPLLTMVFAIQNATVRRGVIVAGIALFSAGQMLFGPLDNHGLTLAHQLHYFLVGFLLVDLTVVEWTRPSVSPGAWDLAATLGWITIALAMMFTPTAAHVLVPAAVFVAYAGAMRGRVWKRITSNAWIFTIGGMCYTIYLYNNQLITTFGHFPMKLAPRGLSYDATVLVQMVAVIPPMLAMSALLFWLLEKPFMRRHWPAEVWRLVTRRRSE